MDILLALIALARQLPQLVADIQALNGQDPTPEQLAAWELQLADSSAARDLEIAEAKARLLSEPKAPPPAMEP